MMVFEDELEGFEDELEGFGDELYELCSGLLCIKDIWRKAPCSQYKEAALS